MTSLVQATDPSSITVAGFITMEISGQTYTLDGTVGSTVVVAYHKPFAESVSLGPITAIVGNVAAAFGQPDFGKTITDEVTALSTAAPPILSSVIAVLNTAPVRITDLAVNTATKQYQFGFALDFTLSDISVAGIKLDAFGLVISYQGKT